MIGRDVKDLKKGDRVTIQLQVARESEIDYCLNTAQTDLEQEILNKLGKDSGDLILECVGVNATMDQSFLLSKTT